MDIFWFLKKNPFSRSTVSKETEQKIKKDWNEIEILLKGRQPSQLRQAVIMADRCLDNALKDIYPDGTSLGDRLKATENRFNKYVYNRVWEAHKIRNNLVHESGVDFPHFVLTDSVQSLKMGLSDLGLKL